MPHHEKQMHGTLHPKSQRLSYPHDDSTTSSAFEFATEDSRTSYLSATMRSNKRLTTFFMIVITILVSVIIMGLFFALLMRVMANSAASEAGLGGTLNRLIKNTTDFLHDVFPPNGARTGGRFLIDGSALHPNGSLDRSKPLILFGEGNGFSLDRILSVTGAVIKAVNQSEIQKQQQDKSIYHAN